MSDDPALAFWKEIIRMSKSADLFKTRLKEVEAEIAKVEKAVEKAQDAYRKNPSREASRALNDAKQPLFALCDEKADLAAAISRASGGRAFGPPA